MTPQSDVYEVIELLPWALQRDTARYVASVRENADELFREAHVGQTPEQLEQLLFLAAIQKLWATVNAQAWIADSTLGLIQEPSIGGARHAGAAGLRIGRATYSRDSEEYIGLQRIRADLDQTLRNLDIRELIRKSLVELIRHLPEEEPDGR